MRCNNCFLEITDENAACPHCGYVKGQPAAELYHLYPGTLLNDRYIIGQVLGFGGFGITYKAWDKKLETTVAIKEHYPGGLVNRVPGDKTVVLFARGRLNEYNHGLARFLDEARNMAKFKDHKNIVSIFEFFEENNTAYIVMEFLDGISLNGFLKTNELDHESCLEVIFSVCSALEELHRCNIIHRDVSPDNIYLCLNGDVKLIDFGAARFSASENQNMTIVLKPGFAPLEQYDSISAQGPWTDVYALGATLYLMMTRIKPEESTNRKVQDTVSAPHQLKPEISEQISNAIMKAMALDRHFRFSSIADFKKALYGELPVISLEAEKKKKKRKRLLGIAAAVLLLTVSGLALLSGINKQKEEVFLPEVQMSVCYEITGEELVDEAKEAALSEILHEFTDAYDTVDLELIGYKNDVYGDTVKKKIQDGAVVLFESTSFTQEECVDAACSVQISDSVAEDNEVLKEYFKNGAPERIPLGFTVPVIYAKGSDDQDMPQGTVSVKEAEELFAPVFCESEIADLVENETMECESDPYRSFEEGDRRAVCGSSDRHIWMRDRMAGRYRIAFLNEDEILCGYTDFYSLSRNAGEEEREVAARLLEHLLSDKAQECMYVQNGLPTFPVNETAMDIYCSVYDEFSQLAGE